MNKGLALWFAVSSMALITLCAILINESPWLAVGVGLVAVLNIGWGFVTKARIRRKTTNVESPSASRSRMPE